MALSAATVSSVEFAGVADTSEMNRSPITLLSSAETVSVIDKVARAEMIRVLRLMEGRMV